MNKSAIPYRNKYAYVERVQEGKRIKFKVRRTDGGLCHAFTEKQKAIDYAKNLDAWKLLWENKSEDD